MLTYFMLCVTKGKQVNNMITFPSLTSNFRFFFLFKNDYGLENTNHN